MADVTFRRGVEENLPTSGMAEDGCIYQSTDTGNVYIGGENGELIPVNRSPYYGTCATASATNAKVVTLDVDDDNFVLVAGTTINVRFANSNTAASPTLNVNSTGAIAAKEYGTTAVGGTEATSWHVGEVVTFVYDGSYWMRVGEIPVVGTLNTNNTSALTPSASEPFTGDVNLHKVSKTGSYNDLNDTPVYALGESVGGPAKKAISIPFGQVDSTSTSTVFTATVDGITELIDGVFMYLRNGVVNSASGFTININGLGAKPVYQNIADATRVETGFLKAKTFLFAYNSTRVSGGCWDIYYGISSVVSDTNSIGYLVRTNSSTLPAKFKTYRYRLLFTSADGNYYVGANASTSTNATAVRTPTTEKIDPFGRIVYYGSSSAVNANANFSTSYLYQQNNFTLGYSFNSTGVALVLDYPKPVYIKCAPQTDGSAIIDAENPYVQSLPSTEDGKIYIFLGLAYSATNVELTLEHPVYYYKDGAIRIWANEATQDDTNFVHKTGAETIGGMKTFSDTVKVSWQNGIRFLHTVQGLKDVNMTLLDEASYSGKDIFVFSDVQGNDVVVRGVQQPEKDSDAVNKKYLDDIVGDIETLLAAI